MKKAHFLRFKMNHIKVSLGPDSTLSPSLDPHPVAVLPATEPAAQLAGFGTVSIKINWTRTRERGCGRVQSRIVFSGGGLSDSHLLP